jgi:hypothetical protein
VDVGADLHAGQPDRIESITGGLAVYWQHAPLNPGEVIRIFATTSAARRWNAERHLDARSDAA